MPIIPVKTTYLSMDAAPVGEPRKAPRPGLLLLRAQRPTLAYYRFLYTEVGRDLMWVDRNFMPDPELAAEIHTDAVTIEVLYVDGVPAGYYELYAEADGSIRLAYFGLMSAFRGMGLGSWLLDQAIHDAWSRRPTRLWLHTCELDSPAALPTYLHAGFQVTHTEMVQQRVPEEGARGEG
ncbi:MAG: GNAT family N-acetyltransferase [Candidatus Sericytochromatia bacterium]